MEASKRRVWDLTCQPRVCIFWPIENPRIFCERIAGYRDCAVKAIMVLRLCHGTAHSRAPEQYTSTSMNFRLDFLYGGQQQVSLSKRKARYEDPDDVYNFSEGDEDRAFSSLLRDVKLPPTAGGAQSAALVRAP